MDRWQFEGGDGETFVVEAEAIRDDTIVRIKRKDVVVETHRWSGSLLVQALLALVEQPENADEEPTVEAYVARGYEDRGAYLTALASEFGVDLDTVHKLAEQIGPGGDFDTLPEALEDAHYQVPGTDR